MMDYAKINARRSITIGAGMFKHTNRKKTRQAGGIYCHLNSLPFN
jgi:hypothetical protein